MQDDDRYTYPASQISGDGYTVVVTAKQYRRRQRSVSIVVLIDRRLIRLGLCHVVALPCFRSSAGDSS